MKTTIMCWFLCENERLVGVRCECCHQGGIIFNILTTEKQPTGGKNSSHQFCYFFLFLLLPWSVGTISFNMAGNTIISDRRLSCPSCLCDVCHVCVCCERDLPVLLQSSDIARLFPWSDLNTIIERSHFYRQTVRHVDCRDVQYSS